jgi:hypothetical protein
MQNVLTKASTSKSANLRFVIWASYVSGFIAFVGLVFLAIFFAGAPLFGPLNDMAVVIHYFLLLPIMGYLYQILKPYGERLNKISFAIGLVGVIGVIVLQSMLVLGAIPFQQQIVLVIPAFLIGAVWFVLIERLGRRDDRIPKGLTLHILAGLVFAYPVWAFKLARNLERELEGGSR